MMSDASNCAPRSSIDLTAGKSPRSIAALRGSCCNKSLPLLRLPLFTLSTIEPPRDPVLLEMVRCRPSAEAVDGGVPSALCKIVRSRSQTSGGCRRAASKIPTPRRVQSFKSAPSWARRVNTPTWPEMAATTAKGVSSKYRPSLLPGPWKLTLTIGPEIAACPAQPNTCRLPLAAPQHAAQRRRRSAFSAPRRMTR